RIRLLREPLRVRVVREEPDELVAERRDAARFEPDHRRPALDLLVQVVEDLAQLALRQVEHAVVVEWPAAAEALGLDEDLETGVLEHLDGGLRDLRVEEVVEGVRPEQDALSPDGGAGPRLEPGAERLRGELRHLSRRRDAPGP